MQLLGAVCQLRSLETVRVLFCTDRHGKDAKRCILLLTTAVYIICYALAASVVNFYFVYVRTVS